MKDQFDLNFDQNLRSQILTSDLSNLSELQKVKCFNLSFSRLLDVNFIDVRLDLFRIDYQFPINLPFFFLIHFLRIDLSTHSLQIGKMHFWMRLNLQFLQEFLIWEDQKSSKTQTNLSWSLHNMIWEVLKFALESFSTYWEFWSFKSVLERSQQITLA